MVEALAGAIQRCASWHGTPQVCITPARPRRLCSALRKHTSAAGHWNPVPIR
jgi:hypothetical protein